VRRSHRCQVRPQRQTVHNRSAQRPAAGRPTCTQAVVTRHANRCSSPPASTASEQRSRRSEPARCSTQQPRRARSDRLVSLAVALRAGGQGGREGRISQPGQPGQPAGRQAPGAGRWASLDARGGGGAAAPPGSAPDLQRRVRARRRQQQRVLRPQPAAQQVHGAAQLHARHLVRQPGRQPHRVARPAGGGGGHSAPGSCGCCCCHRQGNRRRFWAALGSSGQRTCSARTCSAAAPPPASRRCARSAFGRRRGRGGRRGRRTSTCAGRPPCCAAAARGEGGGVGQRGRWCRAAPWVSRGGGRRGGVQAHPARLGEVEDVGQRGEVADDVVQARVVEVEQAQAWLVARHPCVSRTRDVGALVPSAGTRFQALSARDCVRGASGVASRSHGSLRARRCGGRARGCRATCSAEAARSPARQSACPR
jgi:hypothetical protein